MSTFTSSLLNELSVLAAAAASVLARTATLREAAAVALMTMVEIVV